MTTPDQRKDKITMTPGQAAFEAWTSHHYSWHHGCKMLGWDELGDKDHDDWEAAARAVLAPEGGS